MRVRLTNVRFVENGFEADVDMASGPNPIPPPPPMVTPVEPTPLPMLPIGYDRNEGVAFGMLKESMERRGWSAVSVQGKGAAVAEALNADWPGLDAYAHRTSDALMLPGFGSIDFTISSGEGGFYFRPDHQAVYEPDPSKR